MACHLLSLMFNMEEQKIQRRILSYLIEHPDAQDTLTGIVEWWLLEQELKSQTEMVMHALAGLVDSGLLIETRLPDSDVGYSLNRGSREILEFLNGYGSTPDETGDSIFRKRGANF